MPTRETVLTTLRHFLPEWKRDYPIASLRLFGSFARNEQTSSSDIDLLVDFTESIDAFAFVDLAERMETALKRPVDLVPGDALRSRSMRYIEKDLVNV